MNIDSVTTTTMLVFSSLSPSPFFFKQQQPLLSSTYTAIFQFCYRHTYTRIFFTFFRFFSPSLLLLLSPTIVSFQLLLLICVELAMYECMYITMMEKNSCIVLCTIVVLPLIQSILACIPVFFYTDIVNLATIETYLSIR